MLPVLPVLPVLHISLLQEALSRIDDIELQLRHFRGLRASQLAVERQVVCWGGGVCV